MSLEFTFDGNCKDYNKITQDAAWLLTQATNGNIDQLKFKITDGEEKDFIQGLVADVFSETNVKIVFMK